ncbi:MAG: ribosome small subunit-dependent GTPase A [Clostridiaceae bacterium]|nr:ribosome small subunit-dependent GTPase A [Clostridiaceae bacterium]
MLKGIITKGVGGFYEVLCDDNTTYTCKVRGVYRKDGGITPLPGDIVTFKVLDEKDREGHIEEIKERRNYFNRPPVANIDQLVIVIAVESPNPDFMLVDKLIITCMSKNIRPLLVINKTDLDKSNGAEEIASSYRSTGFPIIYLNKFEKDKYEDLHRELTGHITAFAGQSGVGKSTILNIVMDNWLMDTGEVSDKIKRGRHTTRHVQLFKLDEGGFIVDTPGFSSFSINDIEHDELENMYPEFEPAIGYCRFKGCSHTCEPDCAVRELVSEGKLDERRYNRYVELYRQLKENFDNRYKR